MTSRLMPPSTTNTVPGIQRPTRPSDSPLMDNTLRNVYDNLHYLRNELARLSERISKLESAK